MKNGIEFKDENHIREFLDEIYQVVPNNFSEGYELTMTNVINEGYIKKIDLEIAKEEFYKRVGANINNYTGSNYIKELEKENDNQSEEIKRLRSILQKYD